MTGPYYIGVDVGTSSVRAALVTSTGHIMMTSTKAISIWEPSPDFYEQSSDEIWLATCKVIKDVSQNVNATEIHGVGFDATASLVVLDANFKPVAVSEGGSNTNNVIMWMDHRAVSQAKEINDTCHKVLQNVGGKVSLEMQLPKILWLKQNQPNLWKSNSNFFDLPDFLTWKATGNLSRSLCSLVCKWTYQADENSMGWDESIFQQIGLKDIISNQFKQIGQEVKSPGLPCGQGLTADAAKEMGLCRGTAVSVSIIDAHAGGLGTLGCKPRKEELTEGRGRFDDIAITSKLAIICGTSTCHMIVSEKPVFVNGVWGPYYSAMIPHLWLNEGGQSATGKLLDHIIGCHPANSWLLEDAKKRQIHPHLVLNEVLEFMANKENVESVSRLTSHFHVWPDYHGNRSPLADPLTRGMISGLSLSNGMEDLALQYLATMQALVYGTRHIIETMKTAGHSIDLVYICGGLINNKLFVQLHSDILGIPVVLPDVKDSVLLGSAILAASASRDFQDISDAMNAMSGSGNVLLPNDKDVQYHASKYKVFLSMIEHQKKYEDIMNSLSTSS